MKDVIPISIQIARVDPMNNGHTSSPGHICAFVEIHRYKTFEVPADNADPITNGFVVISAAL